MTLLSLSAGSSRILYHGSRQEVASRFCNYEWFQNHNLMFQTMLELACTVLTGLDWTGNWSSPVRTVLSCTYFPVSLLIVALLSSSRSFVDDSTLFSTYKDLCSLLLILRCKAGTYSVIIEANFLAVSK